MYFRRVLHCNYICFETPFDRMAHPIDRTEAILDWECKWKDDYEPKTTTLGDDQCHVLAVSLTQRVSRSTSAGSSAAVELPGVSIELQTGGVAPLRQTW